MLDLQGQTSITPARSMGDGIYPEQPNAMAINQASECQPYQYPTYTVMDETRISE